MFQIFLGYLLIFFSFKVGGIDLSPNFVGYFLIFLGLSNNLNKSYKFSFAKPLSLVLSIFSLIGLVAPIVNKIFNLTLLDSNSILSKVIFMIFDLAVVVLTYLILAGYRDIEKNEKVNMKMFPAFILFIINSVVLIALNVLVFFISISLVENISMVLIMVNSITNFVFAIYMYLMYRNYNIEIYNKNSKADEWYSKNK